MRERVERRLGELRAEYQAGRKMLARLEAEQADLEQTLLRISGAIQVLEELLDPTDPPTPVDGAP
jgi:hypothetical protein